jgi:hypothetical protein
MLTPGHRAARIVGLLHCDVSHQTVGRGAVPVILPRLEEDAVAGPDHLDLTAAALTEADALGDEDRLPERVSVCQAVRAPGVK